MKRRRKPSGQTIAVLQALLSHPADWRYGYDLTKEIGLPSGTLYPMLMRLADQGLLESEWHAAAREGMPARHAYRLTQKGVAFVRAGIGGSAEPWDSPGLAPA